MVVSIRLPESNSTYTRKRRYSTRFFRKLLVAVVLALVLLLWFLGSHGATKSDDGRFGVRSIGAEDMDLGVELVGLKSLVIVTCHAIWLGGITGGEDEKEWLVDPFFSKEGKLANMWDAGQSRSFRGAKQRRL